jgi:hypothetical protein
VKNVIIKRWYKQSSKLKSQKSPPKGDPLRRRAGLSAGRQAPLEEKLKNQNAK